MPDRKEGSAPPGAPRRRREESGVEGAVSVADLLARHARENDELPAPRAVTGHQAPAALDETDRIPRAAVGPPDDEAPTELVPRALAVDDPHPVEFVDTARPAGSTHQRPVELVDTTGPASPTDSPAAARPVPEESPEEVTDVSERVLRTRRIDESLQRLTAIHAGLGAEVSKRVRRSSRPASAGARANRGGGPPDDPGPGAGPGAGAALGRRGPLARAGRVALVALAAVLFAVLGAGWAATAWLDGTLRSVAALDPDADSIRDAAAQDGDHNFLLVGTEDQAASTVLLAHLPADRSRTVVLALPHDLRVDRPSCDLWDPATAGYPSGTVPARPGSTLYDVYRAGGPRCLTKVVQKLTGMPVHHFAVTDFAGFPGMVDAAGGVPICLDRPVVDGAFGRVVPTAGRTVLTGQQALGLLRARDVRGDPTPDYGQAERQQRFLAALAARGLSEQVLTHPGVLRAFVGAFAAHSLTDGAGLTELSALGGALRNRDPAATLFVTVPTVLSADGDGSDVLRDTEATALFTALRTHQPLPGQRPASAGDTTGTNDTTRAADALPPSEVTLTVRNGSSRAGLAGQVADSLRSVGFRVGPVGDTTRTEGGSTLIRHSPDRSTQAATVAAAVPSAVNQTLPGGSGTLELVLGDRFDGEISTAGLGGAPASPLLSGAPTTLQALTDCR